MAPFLDLADSGLYLSRSQFLARVGESIYVLESGLPVTIHFLAREETIFATATAAKNNPISATNAQKATPKLK
jgi:hypothetical protein